MDAAGLRPARRHRRLDRPGQSTPEERRQAYAADICYASASEIGFDVLRDRLATASADLVTTEPDVVLIDEADSVLVDEALVPLVLAGSAGGSRRRARAWREIAGRLLPRLHYEVDDERRNVYLTDAGTRVAEQALGGINLYAEAEPGPADPAQRGAARPRPCCSGTSTTSSGTTGSS